MSRDADDEAATASLRVDAARASIDHIDRRIVGLLAERMQAVAEVGDAKADQPERPVLDPARQREVAGRWREEAERRGLPRHFAERVLRELIRHSHRDQERRRRADERPARVGFQGAFGCYGDDAVARLFHARGGAVERRPYATFAGLLDALELDELDYALLPVENSSCGSVPEAVQLLTERRLHVVDEEVVTVDHCLAARPGARLEDLRVVRSHPVALLQCQRLLRSLPGVTAQACHDTAGAADDLRADDDPTVGVVCSAAAARDRGLDVLREHVADHDDNQTRFVLLARAPDPAPPPDLPRKTSLVFEAPHRRGALLRCLEVFARHDANLTRIESRPIPERPWRYSFLVDVEGDAAAPALRAALDELRPLTGHLRVLGSYPDRTADRAAATTDAPAPTPAPTCAVVAPPAPERACPERATVHVGEVAIGPDTFTLIAGPCAVETERQVQDAAAMARLHGATLLRGGVFKPRTSPYSFQGLGLAGLDLLVEAGRQHGLPVVTEVLRVEDVDAVAARADMLQIGARNMQNFALLQAVGRTRRPVLLKRGMSATVDELVLAAEYVLREGNQQVVLCERGIRTFERATRATLDVSAVPVLRERTHLPVIVDPSHAAGRRDLVVPLALAAAAAGADGLIVEVHPRPDEALCDKDQALSEPYVRALADGLRAQLAARGLAWPGATEQPA